MDISSTDLIFGISTMASLWIETMSHLHIAEKPLTQNWLWHVWYMVPMLFFSGKWSKSFRKPKTHIPNSSYSCVGCTLNRTYIHLDSASIDRCSDKDTPHVATRYTYIHMYVSTYVHIIPSSRELFNFEPNLISETDCVYTLPLLLLLWPFQWCSGRQLNESRQEGRPTRNPPHATPYVHWGKIPT